MPYIDLSKNVQAVNIFHTVRMNYESCTRKEVEADILARKVQARVCYPLHAEFKNMVHDKLLVNFPVKLEHITNANNIYGPSVVGLRGNSARTNPTRVKRE